MKTIILVALIFFLGSSCSTYRKASKAMDSWNGHSKQELYSQWGAPNEVFQTEDGEIVIYYGNTHYHHNVVIGTTTTSNLCKIQFFISGSGKIYNNRFDECGNKYIIKRKHK